MGCGSGGVRESLTTLGAEHELRASSLHVPMLAKYELPKMVAEATEAVTALRELDGAGGTGGDDGPIRIELQRGGSTELGVVKSQQITTKLPAILRSPRCVNINSDATKRIISPNTEHHTTASHVPSSSHSPTTLGPLPHSPPSTRPLN